MEEMAMTKGARKNWLIVLCILWITSFIVSCVHDPFVDGSGNSQNEGPPPIDGCVNDGNVCFESSVLPVFQSACARSGCHDSRSRREGYVLDSYSNIMRKGIQPGNANGSKLYRVLFGSGEDRMPPDAPLTQAQKDSIALWINQGALNTTNCNCFCDPAQFTFAAIVQPIIVTNCVGCHKPGSLGGNIDLSTYASVKAQADNGKLVGSITHAGGYSPMPQGGKLSDCQIGQIVSWVSAGSLNN
ncbi:MAG TPA: c-type cytochrome [Cyclobacteriaceae bacterium]|nr:c-type cytochrome [Cyclobacteriaceae bacterium]